MQCPLTKLGAQYVLELVYEVSDEITKRTVCSDDKQTRCSQLEEQQACIFSMTGTTVTVHFYLLSINVGTRLLPCQEDVRLAGWWRRRWSCHHHVVDTGHPLVVVAHRRKGGI